MTNKLLHQILASTVRVKIINNEYKNNKFRILTRKWNDKFGLHGGLYSVSDIPDYFGYIISL